MEHQQRIGKILEILSVHRRQSLRSKDVDVVADHEIVDLYAARVVGTSDYLVRVGAEAVEEAEFEGWPPLRPRSPNAGAADDDRRKNGMRIGELMSRDVQYCTPNETLDSAAALMWDYDCGCLPVCSTNGVPHVIGMLTDRDICMSALFQGKPLHELRVADAMSRRVHSCRPTDRPAQVERVMRDLQIRRVPVTSRNGELLGIVSLADLAIDAEQSGGVSAVAGTLAAICEPRTQILQRILYS